EPDALASEIVVKGAKCRPRIGLSIVDTVAIEHARRADAQQVRVEKAGPGHVVDTGLIEEPSAIAGHGAVIAHRGGGGEQLLEPWLDGLLDRGAALERLFERMQRRARRPAG